MIFFNSLGLVLTEYLTKASLLPLAEGASSCKMGQAFLKSQINEDVVESLKKACPIWRLVSPRGHNNSVSNHICLGAPMENREYSGEYVRCVLGNSVSVFRVEAASLTLTLLLSLSLFLPLPLSFIDAGPPKRWG